MIERMGLIAGNGRLPMMVVSEARRRAIPLTVAAIKEEADPALEASVGASPGSRLEWIGVGQLGKLLRLFKKDGVQKAMMVGQVQHVRIFAPGSRSPLSQLKHLPDLKMVRLLGSLKRRNTASLIEAVIGELEKEGVEMVDSTILLEEILVPAGVLSQRPPDEREQRDIAFGHPVAREVARLDIGQTIVVKDQAVVAVEAMEGTDAVIRRAGELAGAEKLTMIKAGRPSRDLRFDVPVIGPATVTAMSESGVTALALEAGQCLLVDREALLEEADRLEIAIVGLDLEETS